MSLFVKNRIPVFGVMIIGFIAALAFYLPLSPLKTTASALNDMSVICYNLILVLGIMHVGVFNARQIVKKAPQWWSNFIPIFVILIYFIPPVLWTTRNTIYRWGTNYIYTASTQAISGLMAFWIIGACARTFRARSWETLVLLIVGFAVILRNAPLGGMIFPPIDYIADWMMSVPSPGAGTGVIIGTTVGQAALSLRYLTGIDRTYLGIYEE